MTTLGPESVVTEVIVSSFTLRVLSVKVLKESIFLNPWIPALSGGLRLKRS